MVVDHWEYYGDRSLVHPLLPIIDGVLEFFARHTTDRGLVEGLPKRYWSFVDWHDDWEATPGFKDSGVPVQGRKRGTFTFFTLFYAYTLRRASTLSTIRIGFASDYERRARIAITGVQRHCFDCGVFTDTVVAEMDQTPNTPGVSQHCQVFAVLVDALEPSAAMELLASSLDPSNNHTACSYTFQHYLLRAAAKVGLYDTASEQVWEPYRTMIRNNLTTWQETPSISRSDCHAWASLPLYEFPAEVAGFTPATPGWDEVRFAPRVDWSDLVDLSVAMGGLGKARIRWGHDKPQGRKHVRLELPVERTVRVECRGRTEVYPVSRVIEFWV